MTLPFLVSVPHAGLTVPPEVADLCVLTREQLREDGDRDAREIYALEADVRAFVTTEVPRAIVDLNRAETDRRADGVVKTETIFQEAVYRSPLDDDIIEALLARYYRPYHAKLSAAAADVRFGVDCHTMLGEAPPIGPDPGAPRPEICLGNGGGITCPSDLFETLAECLEEAFGCSVSRNQPFQGGHIVRSHASELPWVQLELSRAPFATVEFKRDAVRRALLSFAGRLGLQP